MIASEALYFTNAPVLHIVQHDERKRLARIQAQAQAAFRALPRVPSVRAHNDRLLALLTADRALTDDEAAYVARCEADAA